MGDLSESLNKEIISTKKDIEAINKNQSERKITVAEMENILEEVNSSLDETEDWISKSEDNITVSTQREYEKGLKRNDESLRSLWDNIKHNNIHIIGESEEMIVSKGQTTRVKNNGRKLP